MSEDQNKNVKEAETEYDELGFVKNRLCPNCGSPDLKLSYVDDAGTEWLKCEKCGKYCTKAKAKERKELEEGLKRAHEKLSIDDLIEILGSTIKRDNQNKVITFFAMILTYTEADQINIGFLAESSAGKSYIALEISQYFPSEDVIKLGYASPTAFFHDYGVLMLRDGVPVNWDMKPNKAAVKEDLEVEKGEVCKEEVEEAYKREMRRWKDLLRGSYYLVDLHQKILIFLDMPHDQLLQRLRSLLSHDDKTIALKITDKKEKGGLRTKSVVIRGFPTVVFCSAKFSLADQEKTRLLLLSPEITQEKLRESIALKIERESNREEFLKRLMEDPRRRMLVERVRLIKEAKIKEIVIPEEYRSLIFEQFLENHRFLTPRHQRDISRLLALIKAHALLNFMHRERVNNAIIAEHEDVEAGFRLYSAISEANELGLSPDLFNIFIKLKPCFANNGLTLLEFQKAYFEEFHKPIGYDAARKVLKTLTSVGLLIEKPDAEDKRIPRYFVFEGGVKNSADESLEKILPHSEKQKIAVAEGLELIKNWLLENKDERGLVDAKSLADKIRELGLDVQQTVQILKDEFWLREVPELGRFGVK